MMLSLATFHDEIQGDQIYQLDSCIEKLVAQLGAVGQTFRVELDSVEWISLCLQITNESLVAL